MINDIITVRNEKDIANFLDNMNNADYLTKKLENFDGTLIKLKLDGDNFKSSLTGTTIIGLAKLQEKIYQVYLTNKYGPGTRRKVTPEEAKKLEIKVTIKEGSTEAVIEWIFKTVMGALNTMTPEQIQATLLSMAGIIMGGIVLASIGKKTVASAFKTKRKSLELAKAQAKNEIEKKKIESQEAVLKTAIEAVREMSYSITRSAPSLVTIDDKAIPVKTIESVAEGLELEKPEVIEEQKVISGTYRIQRVTLDYKKDSASTDVFDVDTGDPINGIVLQHKSISDGSYRILKTAQDKHDVKMQLIITIRNERISKAVLDKILD